MSCRLTTLLDAVLRARVTGRDAILPCFVCYLVQVRCHLQRRTRTMLYYHISASVLGCTTWFGFLSVFYVAFSFEDPIFDKTAIVVARTLAGRKGEIQ